jgi:Swi5-dependent recombination DNA repair protein 1
MSTPAAKRRRIDAASQTLSKPFRSPFKRPFQSPLKAPPSTTTPPTQPGVSTPLKPPNSNTLSFLPALPEKTPNLPFTIPNRSPRRKTFSSPLSAVVLNADLDIAPLLRTQKELERQLREVREELEQAEQARKIERESRKKYPNGEVDGELVALIEKWRGASRLAAEELFGKVRDRVNRYVWCINEKTRWGLMMNRMGGPRAWKEMQKKQQEFQNLWDTEEQNNIEEEREEGRSDVKRDLYAEYGIDPETENEKSQREKGTGDTGELPGQEDVGTTIFRPAYILILLRNLRWR